MVILEIENARLEIDETIGGRLASLRIDDLELLVTGAEDSLHWGCYPMAPWASRVENGRFQFAGRPVQLPLRMPPHAIHGTVLDRPWRVYETSTTTCVLETDLGEEWPWAGTARQVVRLSATGLDCRLEVSAQDKPFPASLGWHPWFLRRLERGRPVELDFEAGGIYLTDAAGLPTGEVAPPGPGPFDDCFAEVSRNPVLCWPGALELTLSTNLDHWIVYSLPEHAICVEPVSAPPNVFNWPRHGTAATLSDTKAVDTPAIVRPGQPLVGEFTWTWRRA